MIELFNDLQVIIIIGLKLCLMVTLQFWCLGNVQYSIITVILRPKMIVSVRVPSICQIFTKDYY